MMLLISTLMMGIEKPTNNGAVRYNEDRSVNLSHFDVPENKIQELIVIFNKADLISNYCTENDYTEYEREIGRIDKGKYMTFIFTYVNGNIEITDDYIITTKGKPTEHIHHWRIIIKKDNSYSYVDLLTTIKNKYYLDLDAYNTAKKLRDDKISGEIEELLENGYKDIYNYTPFVDSLLHYEMYGQL